jgi:hypothetical protein
MRAVLAGVAAASAFVITDMVYVNGDKVCEGDDVEDNLGCHPIDGVATFKVCGSNVKVVAHLMSDCRDYGKYSETIGTCDRGLDANHCDEKTLTSGYTHEFKWKAYSYEILACK